MNEDVHFFSDTEALSQAIKHTNVRALQIGTGPVKAERQHRRIEDWSFQYIKFWDGSACCSGDTSPDRTLLLVPLNVVSGCRLLGEGLLPSHVGVYAPGSEHGDVTRAGLYQVVLAPPKGLLEGAEVDGNPLALPRCGSQLRKCSEEAMSELRAALIGMRCFPRHGTASPTSQRAIQDRLTVALLRALSAEQSEVSAGRVPLPRQPVLRQLRELIATNSGEPLFASELAVRLGISQPTLQRIFLEWYGVPPAKYLMLKRLYLARTRLRSGEFSTVGEVASSCGFWELSRFAKRYARTFGELPSQTLRANRH